MAMGAVVMLVIWTGRVAEVPTWTLPKLSDEGREVERGGIGDAEEGDELECGAGVGVDLEGGDAIGHGVGEAGLRSEADVDGAAGGGD